jgi:hypothetical protein
VQGLVLRPCTPEDQAKCLEQHGARHLEWACAHCKQVKPEEVSPYVLYLLGLRRLVKAGYPLAQDDLDLETWRDLGEVNEALEESREQQRWQGILKPLISASRWAPKGSRK